MASDLSEYTWFNCGICEIPLHFPSGAGFPWPCAHRYHSVRHKKFCYVDCPRKSEFQRDPQVDRVKAMAKEQQSPPAPSADGTVKQRRKFVVTQPVTNEPSKEAPKRRRDESGGA